jgi:hypothetical protein
MPLAVQEQYCLSNIDESLQNLILCKYGLYRNGVPIYDESERTMDLDGEYELQLCVCNDCMKAIQEAKPNKQLLATNLGVVNTTEHCKPPINSIANGNWIGYLPKEFEGITRTEEQTVALMTLQIYLSTVIASDNKVLNSHTYCIKNPHPILRYFSNDVVGKILFTIVGANIPELEAMVRQRFPMDVDLARSFLAFLDDNNVLYKSHDHQLGRHLEEAMKLENFIVDRTDTSDDRVSPKLVDMMQFGITSYNHGTADASSSQVVHTLTGHGTSKHIQPGSPVLQETLASR